MSDIKSIRLLGRRIAILESEGSDVSKGGIHLTKTLSELRGTVKAVGPGDYDEKGNFIDLAIEVGDTVIYSKQENASNTRIEVNGELLMVMHEDGVIAVVR